jgi:predicted DNA-binding protein (UPF0251 family)
MRPQKLRLIAVKPACRRFSPDTGNDAPAMTLGLDMLEALRLADAEGLSQEEAARWRSLRPRSAACWPKPAGVWPRP